MRRSPAIPLVSSRLECRFAFTWIMFNAVATHVREESDFTTVLDYTKATNQCFFFLLKENN